MYTEYFRQIARKNAVQFGRICRNFHKRFNSEERFQAICSAQVGEKLFLAAKMPKKIKQNKHLIFGGNARYRR